MTISIQFPSYCINNEEAVLQRVTFCLSPLHEMIRSLHVLLNPKHHGIHLPWVIETSERMSEEMRVDLEYFSLCYELGVPQTLLPGLKTMTASVPEEIQMLAGLSPDSLLNELTHIKQHHENEFIPQLARGIEWKGFSFAQNNQIIEDLKTDPQQVLQRLIDFLTAYWESIFSAIWPKIRTHLIEDIASQSKLLQTYGFASFINSASARIRWSKRDATLHFRKPFDWHYQMSNHDSILFVPSYFVWPHLFVDLTDSGVVIVYDSAKARQEALPPQPIDSIVDVCRALGEPTRLQLLTLLRERELTTQSLAQICHLSEGTVSKHLQMLKKANLVTSKVEGKYVLYRCRDRLFETLSHLVAQRATVS